jgi:hypothetical protein
MWYARSIMPIAGDRPESGVRLALERPREETPPWIYEGAVYTPDATLAARVVVDQEGTVEVSLGEATSSVPPDLAEKVRLIVRAAYRQAKADGEPPARRITRWRGDK